MNSNLNSNTRPKTLFIGAGNFAVTILQYLLKCENIDLQAVVTQPDKPAGRKKLLTPCPVMAYIQEQNLEVQYKVFQPAKIKLQASEILAEIQPELIIVADYGQILPSVIVDYPKFKCLNVHGSLLPDLRGAVPTPMAILKGYEYTGVSIPIMTPGLDDGAVIASESVKIEPNDTTATLRPRLAQVGARLLLKTLPLWLTGQITPVPQDESKATFTWQNDIAKEKAQIFSSTSAIDAERMIRAFNPWPVAWCLVNLAEKDSPQKLQRLKIFAAQLCAIDNTENVQVGSFIKQGKSALLLLKEGALKLLRVQLEGKGVVEEENVGFLVGRKLV